MKRKIIAGMILFVMCISMCMTCFAASFSDLSEEHWAYENITKLVDEGVINGYPDGTYRPESTVSRAEFLKLIMVALERRRGF